MDLSQTNTEYMNEAEIVDVCLSLFTNLGWNVKREETIDHNGTPLKMDLSLYDGNTLDGYVEIVTYMTPSALITKKKAINIILSEYKPTVFILTNGMTFDVFYNGLWGGTVSSPPSITTVRRFSRLMMYQNALHSAINKKGDNPDE